MAKSRSKSSESRSSNETSPATSGPSPLNQDTIASRAYELWQVRGCPIGSPEEDWFRAETELRAQPPQQIRTRAANA